MKRKLIIALSVVAAAIVIGVFVWGTNRGRDGYVAQQDNRQPGTETRQDNQEQTATATSASDTAEKPVRTLSILTNLGYSGVIRQAATAMSIDWMERGMPYAFHRNPHFVPSGFDFKLFICVVINKIFPGILLNFAKKFFERETLAQFIPGQCNGIGLVVSVSERFCHHTVLPQRNRRDFSPKEIPSFPSHPPASLANSASYAGQVVHPVPLILSTAVSAGR